jgi:DNA-binding helix-hairpin-helix protein with protein kinase domain
MGTFVTGTGKTIAIGQELGRGGEGTVYEVSSNHHLVAKLYNADHQPDDAKQAKLRYMATTADKHLLSYAAWPQETLHHTTNGPVVGFLMPKISGWAPIHMLYGPAHRRQKFSRAAWDFLLFAARNTAAAIAAIHQHGHVVGDVNQGNILVGADSRVVLIDTDSFQVVAHGTTHLCKVGVAHFTPPELQETTVFERTPRTSNHDNFGLALLVFHLLFGGRHPREMANSVALTLHQNLSRSTLFLNPLKLCSPMLLQSVGLRETALLPSNG